MQKTLVSRFAVAVMIIGSVFGPALPAFAAPVAPVNLAIVGGKYTNDVTPTFTWTPSAGATWYEVLLDNGEWAGIGNVSTYTYNTLTTGWHTFYVRSHDSVNGVSVSSGLTFEIDTQGPVVSVVTPTTAVAGVLTRFYVTTSGEAPVQYCKLRVNGTLGERMAIDGSRWSQSVTLNALGRNVIQSTCVDADNNWSNGPVSFVGVSKGVILYDDYPVANVVKGTVVKTQCGSYAPTSDDCHIVYYYGLDGKKHLFPSESVYKTWYSSFSNVIIVSKATLNNMPSGRNVTYRPGTSLVKFSNSSTVYAVADGQVLRPIVNEAAAKAIYGSRWTSYVVTLPQAYWNNYTIGSKIYSSADYSKTKEFYGTTTIDQNWDNGVVID